VAAGATGFELISHGILPGTQELDELDGTCAVSSPRLTFGSLGPSISGTFFSIARRKVVGYTIAWPPGHRSGDALPLIVMLHGYGANHSNALSRMTPQDAVAVEVGSARLPPMAMVTVDGGGGYWNPHPSDDPLAMVVDELIPMCQRLGLGRPPQRIGTMGISMGGYGALLIAEKNPRLISAVAAISPAIWTTYDEASAANAGAYASARDFADDDAVTHAGALEGIPVRVASGDSDPFHAGVVALSKTLPAAAVVTFSKGCHDDSFFVSQEPPSLAFLGRHLGA
jgi:S-formylglutathione hydrolase FrmB